MNYWNARSRASYRRIGTGCLAFCLCIAVLSLMLGVPVALANLLVSDEILTESLSEGFSVPPSAPEMDKPSPRPGSIEFDPSLYHLVLAISVFHPPLLSS